LDEDLLCWRCRYNLRGVPDGRCPECGEPFDRAYLLSRAIPWERRAQLGRVWAYLETVVVVSFRPARFAAGVREEREPRHGLRFRMVTTLLVFAFACTLLALVRRQFMVLYWPKPVWAPLLTDPLFFAATLIGSWLWILTSMRWSEECVRAALRAPGLIESRGRAIDLHRYAGAPLLWLIVPLIGVLLADELDAGLVISGEQIRRAQWLTWGGQLLAWSSVIALIPPVMALNRLSLTARAAGAGRAATWLCWSGALAGWACAFVVYVLGLPLAILFGLLLWHGLRT
jgi:hypothetical protein